MEVAAVRGVLASVLGMIKAGALAATLVREREQAMLFRAPATLRTDIPLFKNVDQLRWNGPTPASDALWPLLDVDPYVPSLLHRVFGTGRWIAELGRRGGSTTRKVKAAAARANGRKGG